MRSFCYKKTTTRDFCDENKHLNMCVDAAAAEHFFSCWFVVSVGWKYRGTVNCRHSGQAVVARLGSTRQASARSCKASIIREKQRKRGDEAGIVRTCIHTQSTWWLTLNWLIHLTTHYYFLSPFFLFLMSFVHVFLTSQRLTATATTAWSTILIQLIRNIPGVYSL